MEEGISVETSTLMRWVKEEASVAEPEEAVTRGERWQRWLS